MAKKETSKTRIIVAVVFGVLTLAFVGIYIYSNVKVLTGGDQFWQEVAKTFRNKFDQLYNNAITDESGLNNKFTAAGFTYSRELLKQMIYDYLCQYTSYCYDHEYCHLTYGDPSSIDDEMKKIDEYFNGPYGVLNDVRLLKLYVSYNVEHDERNRIKLPIIVKHDAEVKFNNEILHIEHLNGPA